MLISPQLEVELGAWFSSVFCEESGLDENRYMSLLLKAEIAIHNYNVDSDVWSMDCNHHPVSLGIRSSMLSSNTKML